MSKTTKDILSSSFKLPKLEEDSTTIFKNNLFIRELLPLDTNNNNNNKNKNRIKVTCTNCSYNILSSWPIHTSNLRSHYKHKHYNLFLEDNNNSNNNLEIDSNTTNNSFNSTIRKRPSFVLFDNSKYKDLLLKFIINNNLPFSLVESNSFNNLLNYLKDDLPTISRRTIKRELDILYNIEFEKIKAILANNNSKYSITLNKWNSSNNIDFLAITIHFYNNNFELQSFLLGFETLENKDSYTSTILFTFIDNILKEYNIRNKLLAITRDNASPITSLIEEIQNNYNIRYNINIIDIRCTAHVLNLISNTFLTYLFFIPNNTKKFNDTIDDLKEDNIEYKNLYNKYKDLPNNIRSIITSIKYNHFLKNNFKKIVRRKKSNNNNLKGPKILIKDNSTRWLSTYNMLNRFINLKDEINTLLQLVNKLPTSKKNNINISKLVITSEEWDYLINIRDILEIFRKPTIKFQTSSYSTIYLVIPYITRLYYKLLNYIDKEDNLLINIGLTEASNKLLKYYPFKDNSSFNKLQDLYLVIILNPQFKLDLFKHFSFGPNIINKIIVHFKTIYNKYKVIYLSNNNSNNNINTSFNSITSSNNIDYSSDDEFFRNKLTLLDKEEIDKYLEEDIISKEVNIVDYYKANKDKFPIIYNIAKDYLAIPSSSAPSESTFSKVGDIITKKGNRLLPNTIKQLISLKSWNIIEDEESIINNNLLDFNNLEENIEENIEDIENIETYSITSQSSNNSSN